MAFVVGATVAVEVVADQPAIDAVPVVNDYAAATELARQRQAMLLVSLEPAGADADDAVGRRLQSADVLERFAASATPWVFCRIGTDAPSATGEPRLVDHPSLAELRRGPGIFVVDHAHAQEGLAGRVVSILPRTPGKYYRFDPGHVDELASLPAGTLTQRSLILAVRIHPDGPLSCSGACDPVLSREATAHSDHQARIRRQGHHDWQARSQRIHAAVPGGYPTEVCAESWPNQDLIDSCVDCVASWRQSSGHWNAVKKPQSAFGYDIRRGGDGIWYATGIFAP
jgi:hypothetical protein